MRTHSTLGPRALRALVLLLLVVSSCVAGCGGDDDDVAADAIAFELFPSTRVLKEPDLAALTSSDDAGTLSFASEPPALAGVQVGDVLLAPTSPKTPAGLLRVVTAVERGGALVLRTAAAPLQVAFKSLHLRMHHTADPNDAGAGFALNDTAPLAFGAVEPRFSVVKGRGERSQTYQIVVYDGDGDVGTTEDQVALDATIGGAFSYELSIDFDWGVAENLPKVVKDCLESLGGVLGGPSCSVDSLLPEAKTSFRVDPSLTLDLTARGAASLAFEKKLDVGTVTLPPVPVGPLVFVPSVDILAEVEGGASARFEVGATVTAEAESSVSMSVGALGPLAPPTYEPPHLTKLDVKAKPPVLDLHANATAKVGARLNVSLFGVVGPYATASGVAEITASPLDDPCYALTFALEAELGARVTTPSLPLVGSVTLLDFHTPPLRPVDEVVASGGCTVPPDPPMKPGDGPTPRVYQSPTFVPWAKNLGGTVDGAAVAGGAFDNVGPELAPSLDGRWVASGPFALGLHKIDGGGALTWTSSLAVSERPPLRVLRSVPTPDTGFMLLLEPDLGASFVLAKTTQSGAPLWARSYTLAGDCIATPTHLARAAAGYDVLGSCGSGAGWLTHVSERGDVLGARVLREADARVEPIAMTTSDGERVLVGQVSRTDQNELDWTFATRLDAQDRPFASTAFHCPDRITMQPSAVIPASGGGVTVVGAANGAGFVARVRRDGSLGFAHFPNAGLNVTADLVVSSIASLPTTGMIFAASARDPVDDEPPFIVLGGLDSGGRTLWARRYAISAPAPRGLALPAVAITDDGGALVSAVAEPAGDRAGDLFAMKVFAKDGYLGDGTALASAPLPLEDVACELEARSFAPTLTDVAVATASMPLERR